MLTTTRRGVNYFGGCGFLVEHNLRKVSRVKVTERFHLSIVRLNLVTHIFVGIQNYIKVIGILV